MVETAFWEMIANITKRLDLVFVFVLFVVSLFKGWLVLGYHYTDCSLARDKWERLALRNTNLLETAVSTIAVTAQPKV